MPYLDEIIVQSKITQGATRQQAHLLNFVDTKRAYVFWCAIILYPMVYPFFRSKRRLPILLFDLILRKHRINISTSSLVRKLQVASNCTSCNLLPLPRNPSLHCRIAGINIMHLNTQYLLWYGVSLINNFQKCKINQIYATYFGSGPSSGWLRGAHRGNVTTLTWIVGSGYTILPNIGGPAFPFLLRFSRKRRTIFGEEKPHPKKSKEGYCEKHSCMMCSSPRHLDQFSSM
jgi:hypothetical protein